MQIENDYDKDVYNGDIGYIDDVDPDAGELNASFDGRSVSYGFGELDRLVPAYAATIHKSQGSEYPAVVIPIMTQHYAMLQRNLLYTGITRGKRLVVLVGQKKAVAIAVRNVSGRRRWSKLDEWLRFSHANHYLPGEIALPISLRCIISAPIACVYYALECDPSGLSAPNQRVLVSEQLARGLPDLITTTVRARDDLQKMTVRIFEIETAPAVVVIDLIRLTLGGVGPVRERSFANPIKYSVEF